MAMKDWFHAPQSSKTWAKLPDPVLCDTQNMAEAGGIIIRRRKKY